MKKAKHILIVAGLILCALTCYHVFIRLHSRARSKRISDTRSAISTVAHALELYYVDHGHYPATLDTLTSHDDFDIYSYLQSTDAFMDAWGTLLRYDITTNHVELRSSGEDRKFFTSDDMWHKIPLQK